MSRWKITLISLVVSLVLGALLYFLQVQGPVLFWMLYILLSASVLLFELSLLTHALDQLSYRPVAAIFLVLGCLALFVLAGLAARTLYADPLMYWLYGTIFPAIAGLLYIIDILQSK